MLDGRGLRFSVLAKVSPQRGGDLGKEVKTNRVKVSDSVSLVHANLKNSSVHGKRSERHIHRLHSFRKIEFHAIFVYTSMHMGRPAMFH